MIGGGGWRIGQLGEEDSMKVSPTHALVLLVCRWGDEWIDGAGKSLAYNTITRVWRETDLYVKEVMEGSLVNDAGVTQSNCIIGSQTYAARLQIYMYTLQ